MIQNLYNAQGFHWFFGVVENRNDPLKGGRCQVRIFGDHPKSKEILPTKDLPWAIPMMPINSASVSGKGRSPNGPVEGTWVVGWYLDGPDKQMPMMIGTVNATNIDPESVQSSIPKLPPIVNLSEKEAAERVMDNPNGLPPTATNVPSDWELGKTSEQYESGGRGPGTINDYNGSAKFDRGGASYGTYQFASYLPPIAGDGKKRPDAANSPLIQYIRNSRFKHRLSGLTPGTPEFDAEWKKIASEYPKEFKEDQHYYVKKNYYDVMMTNLKKQGVDLSNYGPSVQDLVWSTAVQLGPGKTEVFTTPLKGKSGLSDMDVIGMVSDYKMSRVSGLFSSSPPSIQQSVKNRYIAEKSSLIKMIG